MQSLHSYPYNWLLHKVRTASIHTMQSEGALVQGLVGVSLCTPCTAQGKGALYKGLTLAQVLSGFSTGLTRQIMAAAGTPRLRYCHQPLKAAQL